MVLETWFILAVASAVAGGIGSFLFKVAAKEKIDIVLLSFCSAVLSSFLIFVCILLYSDLSGWWHPMLLFAGLTAIGYLASNVTKVRSLENIDSAIFFPLYKVFGPGLVILLGIILFQETFSTREWIGLLVSLCVPLLLITRSEHHRQINLSHGLLWLMITVVISSVTAVAWKHGSDIAPNTWMYIFACEAVMIPVAFATMLRKHHRRLHIKFAEVLNRRFLYMLLVAAIVHAVAGATFIFALTNGGTLGIAYTINSLYILIPIILSIVFYNEHWNLRKAVAIVLSIVALAFFG